MKKVTLVFTDGETTYNVPTTFHAYEIIVDADNQQPHDFFIGGHIDNSKEYVNVLLAEKYLSEVAPVESYLGEAALSNFNDEQIIDDIKYLKGQGVVTTPDYWDGKSILSSWEEYMAETIGEYDEYLRDLHERGELS